MKQTGAQLLQSQVRVAILTTSYPLTSDSSSGIFVARLVENLPEFVTSVVITPASRTSEQPSQSRRVAIRQFRYAPRKLQLLAHEPGGIPASLRRRRWIYLLLPGFLASMFISCLMHARNADVIHANWAICGCIAGLVGKLLRLPVVTTLRGDDVTRAHRHFLDRLILSLCMRYSTAVVAVSYAIGTTIRQQYPDQAHKVCTIQNGINDAFLNLQPRSEQHPLRLLTVGSLIPRKGVDRIIRAVHLLSQPGRVSLLIVGDGPERGSLEDLAYRLNLQDDIEFSGALPPSAVPAALAQANVFILASASEGRPNALVEAMAAAVPVIASDIPGVKELVTDGRTGLLFPAESIDRLTECIRTMLDDPDVRIRLGRAAREFVVSQQVTWGTSAERYCRAYQSALKQNRSCAE